MISQKFDETFRGSMPHISIVESNILFKQESLAKLQ